MTDELALTYVLDENGEPRPAGRDEWHTWNATRDPTIDSTSCEGGLVSTVFTGRRTNNDGDPDLWETAIFSNRHMAYAKRYTSKQAAIAGHAHAVRIANGEIPREPHE